MYVTRADIERFGGTEGCPGCACVAQGGAAVIAHSDACRLRIAEKLAESELGAQRLEEHRRKRRGAAEVIPESEVGEKSSRKVGKEERRRKVSRVAPPGQSEDSEVSRVAPAEPSQDAEGSRAAPRARQEDARVDPPDSGGSSGSGLKRDAHGMVAEDQHGHKRVRYEDEQLNRKPTDVEEMVDAPTEVRRDEASAPSAASLDVSSFEVAGKGVVSDMEG